MLSWVVLGNGGLSLFTVMVVGTALLVLLNDEFVVVQWCLLV